MYLYASFLVFWYYGWFCALRRSWCLCHSIDLLQQGCTRKNRRGHEMDATCSICLWMHSVDWLGYKRLIPSRPSNKIAAVAGYIRQSCLRVSTPHEAVLRVTAMSQSPEHSEEEAEQSPKKGSQMRDCLGTLCLSMTRKVIVYLKALNEHRPLLTSARISYTAGRLPWSK